MDGDTAQRFAEVDAAIAETEQRLRTIARQNAALSEMVEVLGSFVAVSLDAFHQHVRDMHDGS